MSARRLLQLLLAIQALAALGDFAQEVRVLGSYPVAIE